MSEPYVGEIRMFGGNFAPVGWALCDGRLLSIAENEVLFLLIGTYYGGDGVTTFALPDLRGRAPIHADQRPGSSNYRIGQAGGVETVTLTEAQLPIHAHAMVAQSATGTSAEPTGAVWAGSTLRDTHYGTTINAEAAPSISAVGGNQPHDNMPPFLTINYIISLYGIFPQQN